MTRSTAPPPPGLASRRAALDALDAVLSHARPLEEALERTGRGLDERDRALARYLAATVLRRLGSLRAVLAGLMERPLPDKARRVELLLLTGAAQILLMEVPDHAAVNLGVTLAGEDAATAGFRGLINAVLRRLAREGAARLAMLDAVALDTPEWLRAGWARAYGLETARAVAAALALEAPLDLTVKEDAAGWAQRLGGRLLSTGSVRLVEAGPVTALPGFDEGAWWVQDAAAALPARLMGDVRGIRLADLCAAPGGKTAQLAAAGALVTAVDRSGVRLKRLRQNLARLGLEADIVEADATAWTAAPFDGVLLDAPCSATGTLRRHPDVAWSKSPADITSLAGLQSRLLRNAADLVAPGGRLVYSTCSLEPEEGEQQIAALLAARADFVRDPVTAAEIGGERALLGPEGEVRTLPFHLPDPDPRFAGLDGFFAARLRRIS
ncbi:MAG TPA: transcription antitermination factor NusB [Xanthobacteraceae bacterium]|nr:transcription antitermination factor NusB [Xanthobacteraceae bacterium]